MNDDSTFKFENSEILKNDLAQIVQQKRIQNRNNKSRILTDWIYTRVKPDRQTWKKEKDRDSQSFGLIVATVLV
jgi:hypothetical protein